MPECVLRVVCICQQFRLAALALYPNFVRASGCDDTPPARGFPAPTILTLG